MNEISVRTLMEHLLGAVLRFVSVKASWQCRHFRTGEESTWNVQEEMKPFSCFESCSPVTHWFVVLRKWREQF